jgi:hypothetical protein
MKHRVKRTGKYYELEFQETENDEWSPVSIKKYPYGTQGRRIIYSCIRSDRRNNVCINLDLHFTYHNLDTIIFENAVYAYMAAAGLNYLHKDEVIEVEM